MNPSSLILTNLRGEYLIDPIGVGEYLFGYVGGISEDAPGFQHMRIAHRNIQVKAKSDRQGYVSVKD